MLEAAACSRRYARLMTIADTNAKIRPASSPLLNGTQSWSRRAPHCPVYLFAPNSGQATSRRLFSSVKAVSFQIDFFSICRMRSLVTLKTAPISSNVAGSRPSSP